MEALFYGRWLKRMMRLIRREGENGMGRGEDVIKPSSAPSVSVVHTATSDPPRNSDSNSSSRALTTFLIKHSFLD